MDCSKIYGAPRLVFDGLLHSLYPGVGGALVLMLQINVDLYFDDCGVRMYTVPRRTEKCIVDPIIQGDNDL